MLCGTLLWARSVHPFVRHSMAHRTGRGESLLSMGDIEANPGPDSASSTNNSTSPAASPPTNAPPLDTDLDLCEEPMDLAHPPPRVRPQQQDKRSRSSGPLTDIAGNEWQERARPVSAPPNVAFTPPVPLSLVLSTSLPTCKHLPSSIRAPVAEALSQQLQHTVASPTEANFWKLLCFPKIGAPECRSGWLPSQTTLPN